MSFRPSGLKQSQTQRQDSVLHEQTAADEQLDFQRPCSISSQIWTLRFEPVCSCNSLPELRWCWGCAQTGLEVIISVFTSITICKFVPDHQWKTRCLWRKTYVAREPCMVSRASVNQVSIRSKFSVTWISVYTADRSRANLSTQVPSFWYQSNKIKMQHVQTARKTLATCPPRCQGRCNNFGTEKTYQKNGSQRPNQNPQINSAKNFSQRIQMDSLQISNDLHFIQLTDVLKYR